MKSEGLAATLAFSATIALACIVLILTGTLKTETGLAAIWFSSLSYLTGYITARRRR